MKNRNLSVALKRLFVLAFAIGFAVAPVLASNLQTDAAIMPSPSSSFSTSPSSSASPWPSSSTSPPPASSPMVQSSGGTSTSSEISSIGSPLSTKSGSRPSVEVEETPSSQSSLDDLRNQLEGIKRAAAATPTPKLAPPSKDSSDSPATEKANERASTPPMNTKNKILQGSIDQYGEAKQQAFNIGLGMVVKHESDSKLKSQIIRVLPASPAEQGGVHASDRLLKETMDSDVVHLTLQRNGKVIQISIKTGGAAMFDLNTATSGPLTAFAGRSALQASAARAALQAGTTRGALHSGTSSTQLKSVVEQMRNHDVVMILDMSGSMQARDCQGLSRWDWVGNQSNDLALAAQQAVSDLTVMLFSTGYQVMEHASPSLIPMIFERVRPNGGTNLSLPLGDALNRYFTARQMNSHVKPLIITIITDGFPTDYDAVKQQIIDAANHTTKDGEISITFMLINGQLSGNRRMEDLDSQLGTPRDIVNLVEFDQVLQLGVKQALFEALSGRQLKNAPLSAPISPQQQWQMQNNPLTQMNQNYQRPPVVNYPRNGVKSYP